MIIASTFDKQTGSVFQHFGRTETFRIYTIDNGKIINKKDVSAVETGGHAALAPFLHEQGVSALIAGGIGGGARSALSSYGIEVFPGVSGDADEAAKAFAEGKLEYNPEASCHHHDGEHTCGHHGQCHHE